MDFDLPRSWLGWCWRWWRWPNTLSIELRMPCKLEDTVAKWPPSGGCMGSGKQTKVLANHWQLNGFSIFVSCSFCWKTWHNHLMQIHNLRPSLGWMEPAACQSWLVQDLQSGRLEKNLSQDQPLCPDSQSTNQQQHHSIKSLGKTH